MKNMNEKNVRQKMKIEKNEEIRKKEKHKNHLKILHLKLFLRPKKRGKLFSFSTCVPF